MAADAITKLDWLLVAMRLSSASYASTYQKYVFGVSGSAVEVNAVNLSWLDPESGVPTTKPSLP